MNLSRRNLLLGMTALPFMDLQALNKLLQREECHKRRLQFPSDENLYLAFNSLRDTEAGELNEFYTIRHLETLLTEAGVPHGSHVIALGLRSGTPENIYGLPGELALLWDFGTPWNGVVTSHIDSRPVPLGKDDPCVMGILGVLRDKTAHHLEIHDPSLAGSVAWTFYEDDTVQPLLGKGFHNAFSDVDGGMTNNIYRCSHEARSGKPWNSFRWRRRLTPFMPNLNDDKIWENFSETISGTVLDTQWLPYIRKQGWPGAAVIVRGSFMNVAQFHMLEVKNRISVSDPEFTIGNGTHPPLRIRYGRELRPFMEAGQAEWTMVGFIWDVEHPGMEEEMRQWAKISDVFGHPFHIHGFRHDGTRMGHTIFCMLGGGKLTASLYPLTYRKDETSFFFNVDLSVLPNTLKQTPQGLSVQIQNDGQSHVRNLQVELTFGRGWRAEQSTVPLLPPGQALEVHFQGPVGRDVTRTRILTLDPRPDFIEGGGGTKNNTIRIEKDLSWSWVR